MNSKELLALARESLATGRRPSRTRLGRSISNTYYAVFHLIAHSSADLLVGRTRTLRNQAAWLRTYRALDHETARRACSDTGVIATMTRPTRTLAEIFVQLQRARHAADYDPSARFAKNQVIQTIDDTERSIVAFAAVDDHEKRAFCVHLLFRKRA